MLWHFRRLLFTCLDNKVHPLSPLPKFCPESSRSGDRARHKLQSLFPYLPLAVDSIYLRSGFGAYAQKPTPKRAQNRAAEGEPSTLHGLLRQPVEGKPSTLAGFEVVLFLAGCSSAEPVMLRRYAKGNTLCEKAAAKKMQIMVSKCLWEITTTSYRKRLATRFEHRTCCRTSEPQKK